MEGMSVKNQEKNTTLSIFGRLQNKKVIFWRNYQYFEKIFRSQSFVLIYNGWVGK